MEIDACDSKPRPAVAEEFPFLDERLELCKVVLALEVELAVRVDAEEVMLAPELDICELERLVAPAEEEEVLLIEDAPVLEKLLEVTEVEPTVCFVTELVLAFELDGIELNPLSPAEEMSLAEGTDLLEKVLAIAEVEDAVRIDTEVKVSFEDVIILLLCAPELADKDCVVLDIGVFVPLDGWVVAAVLLSCGFVDVADDADAKTETDVAAVTDEEMEDLDESGVEEREVELGKIETFAAEVEGFAPEAARTLFPVLAAEFPFFDEFALPCGFEFELPPSCL